MKKIDKIFWTLILLTAWLPFIFRKSEIRLKGTTYEYINTTPNYSLIAIPYVLISIYVIFKIWQKK